MTEVWIGELGDIRPKKDGPVIAWATKDGSAFGALLEFEKERMQPDPRPVIMKNISDTIEIVQKHLDELNHWKVKLDDKIEEAEQIKKSFEDRIKGIKLGIVLHSDLDGRIE